MPSDVELRLTIRDTRAAAHAAITRVLARVARETAQGAAATAPRRSGFLASTVGATGPGAAGTAARTVPSPHGLRQAAATPAAGPDEAYAYAAAVYAFVVELRHPFLFPAALAVLDSMARLCAEEGV